MSLPTEETDNPTDTLLKSISLKRKHTDKGQEMYDHDIKKI